jgi:hypothetical protein
MSVLKNWYLHILGFRYRKLTLTIPTSNRTGTMTLLGAWCDCLANKKWTYLDLDIQPPETMNSVSCCKDKLRVFLALSGNALSMTLVPQVISHSSKLQKSWWKKMGWCLRYKHATPQTPEISTMN